MELRFRFDARDRIDHRVSFAKMEQKPQIMPRKSAFSLKWGLVMALILLGGIGGAYALVSLKPTPEAEAPPVRTPLVSTTPLTFHEGALPLFGEGLVTPRAQISLAAQVPGEITNVSSDFVSGGRVAKDQVLLEIDKRTLEAVLAQNEAERAGVAAELDFTQKQLTRTRRLSGQGFATDERLDSLLADQRRLRAQLQGLDAAIIRAQIDLENASVTAPFDGRVQSETVDLGDYVQTGQSVGELYPVDAFEIVVALTESEAALLPNIWRLKESDEKPKATVRVTYAGATYAWAAEVERAEAGLDRDSRTVNVVVRVDNPEAPGTQVSDGGFGINEAPPLLAGLYAQVEIKGLEGRNVLKIPRQALREGQTLWFHDREGRLQIEPVRVLSRDEDTLFVEAPALSDEVQLITSSLTVVTDGMPVRTQ